MYTPVMTIRVETFSGHQGTCRHYANRESDLPPLRLGLQGSKAQGDTGPVRGPLWGFEQ